MKVNFNDYVLSKHCERDRKERLQFILENVGIGQPLKEVFYYNAYHYITDTGVAILIDSTQQKIITIYLIDEREAAAIFKGKIPKPLQRKISRNYSNGYVRNLHRQELAENDKKTEV